MAGTSVLLPGLFPRSEELIRLTRAHGRGRATDSELAARFETETAALLAFQRELGLQVATSGNLEWADIFRPLAHEGLSVGGIRRWYDTNTFYRPIAISEGLDRDMAAYAAELPPMAGMAPVVTMPGPWTFWDLNGGPGATFAAGVDELLGLYTRELTALPAGSALVFSEPSLVFRQPATDDWAALNDFLAALPRKALIWTHMKDASPILDQLLGLPATGIGVDLTETPQEAVQIGEPDKAILAGVVDGRNTLLEPVTQVTATIEALQGWSEVILVPSTDLHYLPLEVAKAKAGILVEAASGGQA